MDRFYLIRGVLTVTGGFLINFTYSRVSTFGNLSPYVSSYLKYCTNNSWVTNGHMVWIVSVGIFVSGILMPIGGLLAERIGLKLTCLIGGWIMSFGILMTYLAIKHNFWTVVITFGAISGGGNGLIFSIGIAAAIKWFPQHAGLVSGIVVSGFALGSLILLVIQTKMINPLNTTPNGTELQDRYFTDPTVLNRVPSYFLWMGGSYALIHLVVFLIVSDRDNYDIHPEEMPLVEKTNVEKENPSTSHPPDFTLLEAVKDYRFWMLFATIFFRGFSYLAVVSLYKTFGQTFIFNDGYFSYVGAIATLCGSAELLIFGFLFDLLSYKITMSLSIILSLGLFVPFYFSRFIKQMLLAQIVYGTVVCLLTALLSDFLCLIPAATMRCFGKKNLTVIFGCIFTGLSISGIIESVITSELFAVIQYHGVFAISGVGCLISLVLTQFFPKFDEHFG